MKNLPGKLSGTVFAVLLTTNILVRLYLAVLPGYVDDIWMYKIWAVNTARSGIAAAYEVQKVDYPPCILYVLYVVGKVYLNVNPVETEKVPDTTLFTFHIKSPLILFDLVIGFILFHLVSRGGLWGHSRAGPEYGRLAASIYLWNPAVLWISGYWGQVDSVHTALAIGAMALLGRDRPALSGVLLSTAALTKALASPLVPLMAFISTVRLRGRGFVLAGAGGLAAALVVFAPFIVSGRIVDVISSIFLDIEAMPVTSANAHNLWWLLGPWRDANSLVLGFITPKRMGLVLFGASYIAILYRCWIWARSDALGAADRSARLFLSAAAVISAFFFFSTHLHENHLFLAVPLMIAVAGRSRSLAWAAAGCSVAVFINGFLHDGVMPYIMPGILRARSSIIDPALNIPYTMLQLVGSYLNSVLVTVVVATILFSALKSER